jgi:hypothetical protein
MNSLKMLTGIKRLSTYMAYKDAVRMSRLTLKPYPARNHRPAPQIEFYCKRLQGRSATIKFLIVRQCIVTANQIY